MPDQNVSTQILAKEGNETLTDKENSPDWYTSSLEQFCTKREISFDEGDVPLAQCSELLGGCRTRITGDGVHVILVLLAGFKDGSDDSATLFDHQDE